MPTAELVILNFIHHPCLYRILVYISQKCHEISHIVHWLTFEPVLEQVAVATVFPIKIVHVGACYALDGLSHSFVALAYEQVKTFGAVSTNRASSKLVES